MTSKIKKKLSPLSAAARRAKLEAAERKALGIGTTPKPKPKAPKKESVKPTTGDKYVKQREEAIRAQQAADRAAIAAMNK